MPNEQVAGTATATPTATAPALPDRVAVPAAAMARLHRLWFDWQGANAVVAAAKEVADRKGAAWFDGLANVLDTLGLRVELTKVNVQFSTNELVFLAPEQVAEQAAA